MAEKVQITRFLDVAGNEFMREVDADASSEAYWLLAVLKGEAGQCDDDEWQEGHWQQLRAQNLKFFEVCCHLRDNPEKLYAMGRWLRNARKTAA